ncbi:cell division protein ZapA [Candidatus Dependentiae bacterium]|nr:cell division protein ZapA [Candidatus Dependentiae bacterium]
MKELKKIDITLLGKNYSITTDELDDKVFGAVELVNDLARKIKGKNATINEVKLSALVALQLAVELFEKKTELNLFNAQANKLLSDIKKEL